MPAGFGKRTGRKAGVTAKRRKQRVRREGALRSPVRIGPVVEFGLTREQGMEVDTVHPGLLQQWEQPGVIGTLPAGGKTGGHPFGNHGVLVRGDGKEKLSAVALHLRLDAGEVRRDQTELIIRKADAAVVVQRGTVIEFTAFAERNLLFGGSVQQPLIEKGAGGNQQRTQGKAGADIVRRVGENLRVQIPVAVQKRRGARGTFVGQQRGRTGNQHTGRRDQTEQEEYSDKQNR